MAADRKTVVRALWKITKRFGWLLAIYYNNASYFVKGYVLEELENQQVKKFPAPITYSFSVGLSECYI